jgi:hypothetical protein
MDTVTVVLSPQEGSVQSFTVMHISCGFCLDSCYQLEKVSCLCQFAVFFFLNHEKKLDFVRYFGGLCRGDGMNFGPYLKLTDLWMLN